MKRFERYAAFLALGAALAFSPGISAFAAEDPCLECHGLRGLAIESQSFWVHGTSYGGSVHGRLACVDCHKGLVGYPHEPGQRVRCDLLCHVPGATHESQSRAVSEGPHAALTDPPCLACHRVGAPLGRREAQAVCASCHGALDDSRARYPDTPGAFGARAHRRVREEGRAPTCTTCHGVHEVREAAAVRSACAAEACHPGAGASFGELFDHRGDPGRSPWGGAGIAASVLGAVVGLFLLLHAWRGEA